MGPGSRTAKSASALAAVLFDAGGTLIHMPLTAEEILTGLCLELGFQISPAQASGACQASSRYYDLNYLDYTGDQGTFWQAYHGEALRFLGIDDCDGSRAAFLSHGFGVAGVWTAYPEARATCERLRSMDLRLGVVSNAAITVRDLLEQAGLRPYFEIVVASQDIGIQKPDPRIFQAALGRLGVEPGEALFVGDLYDVDVAGARAAGMRPVLIDREGGQARDCAVIHTLEEVVPLVQGLLRGDSSAGKG